MFKKTAKMIVVAIVLGSVSSISVADEVTYFGDFEDGFGPTGISYSSADPYDPGAFAPIFHEMVVGLSKFDPSLGTLTDITVFVTPGSPIFYFLGGEMSVTEIDDSFPDYSASISLSGEVMLNYMSGATFLPVLTEGIPLAGSDVGAAGTGGFVTPVSMLSDGSLTGASSIIGGIDFADFVGPGSVDTLFVDLLVEDTADFVLDNATATATLGFDVFDSDSGADDAVIGITYTYVAAVPEPGTFGVLALGVLGMSVRRKKRA